MADTEAVLVAMSGGVDSAVAAALLRRAGHAVAGVFMCRGRLPADPFGADRPRGCCSVADAADARRVAERLGIAFHVADLQAEFEALEGDFAEAYHRGLTPNPCIQCNRTLKFGALLELADALGCAAVATGHYAIREAGEDGLRLRRARDPAKDQSYVLLGLDRPILARARFPVGRLLKREVRALAADLGLVVAAKPESQDVCFVAEDYRVYLARRDPDRIRPGRFVDTEGRDLGAHAGHQGFTVGQRRGLGRAFGRPMFVLERNAALNRVVLGPAEELGCRGIRVGRVGWISCAPRPPGTSFRAVVQIRHRHVPAPAAVRVAAEDRLEVRFEKEVPAVSPGQGAAIYDGDVLLAGGWIEEAERKRGACA
ncbi:MAG: tRNA 2-thiouridine(34) synthase MnmA [Planctomycetes bacterium]|nr:tRNA 2-thiouridine(34) synthase MnmA [Planctomycetota bacterium]